MIELVVLAAAVALATPTAADPVGSPARWVRASDLPRSEDQTAVTTFDLTIDQSGRPIHCTVIIASSSDRLDAAVCAAVMKRARFRPARDATGLPIPSVRRDRVVWVPDGSGLNSWSKDPDVVVSTPTISNRVRALTEVVIVMDGAGVVDECFVAESAGNAALDDLACAVVQSPEISGPITDAQGVTLRGVRAFFVGFKPGTASSVELR